MYTIKFKNGTIFSTGIAESKNDALEFGWMIYQNARIHNAHKGLTSPTNIDTFEDFCESVEVEERPPVKPYPDSILSILRESKDLNTDDTSRDSQFNNMSTHEVFDACLNWEGIIGYTPWILQKVKDIYGVTLDSIQKE